MEKKEELEDAILIFIEKTLKNPEQESDLEIIPALVHELICLWKY